MSQSGPIATEIMSLASRSVECEVPDARAVSIYLWSGERPDPVLSLLPQGTNVPAAAHRGLAATSPVVEAVESDAVPAAVAAGAGSAAFLAVVPLTTVAATVVGWFDQAPTEAQLDQLLKGAQDVVPAVTHARQLQGTLVVPPSRLVIEQAKGMVMGEHKLPADQAFSVIRAVSQESNVPVRDVATAMVDSVNNPAR